MSMQTGQSAKVVKSFKKQDGLELKIEFQIYIIKKHDFLISVK